MSAAVSNASRAEAWSTAKRPTFRDTLFDQDPPRDAAEVERQDRDQSLELLRSPAFPWLLGVLRKSRDGASVAEAHSLRKSEIGAAAYAAGIRDNSDGLIRFLLHHAREREIVGPSPLVKRVSYSRRVLDALRATLLTILGKV